MEGMEPVNILALEAYEETNNRLQELSDKLGTLETERMELLLRIENFTTLRFQAFSVGVAKPLMPSTSTSKISSPNSPMVMASCN
jgi:chromosome segregation ATPase